MTVDPSFPGGDSTCSRCGQLLWWFRDRIGQITRVAPQRIGMHSPLPDHILADSLEIVEFVMAMEEEFGVTISDDDAKQIKTVGEAIKFVAERRGR